MKENKDDEHLRLLSIFHYVVGGLAGFFALFPILHLIFGLLMVLAPEQWTSEGTPPPAFFGWMFILFPAVFIVMGWIFAGLVFINGRFLTKRRHHTFCLVIAGIECMFVPFGTVLGVFTIIVLMRDSVREQFSATDSADPQA